MKITGRIHSNPSCFAQLVSTQTKHNSVMGITTSDVKGKLDVDEIESYTLMKVKETNKIA